MPTRAIRILYLLFVTLAALPLTGCGASSDARSFEIAPGDYARALTAKPTVSRTSHGGRCVPRAAARLTRHARESPSVPSQRHWAGQDRAAPRPRYWPKSQK